MSCCFALLFFSCTKFVGFYLRLPLDSICYSISFNNLIKLIISNQCMRFQTKLTASPSSKPKQTFQLFKFLKFSNFSTGYKTIRSPNFSFYSKTFFSFSLLPDQTIKNPLFLFQFIELYLKEQIVESAHIESSFKKKLFSSINLGWNTE